MGSNLGDGKRTLQDAWKCLGEHPGIDCLQLSSPYLSAPVDMVSRNWFTNAVGVLTTSLEPSELLHILLAIEADFGRRRDETAAGYQDRSLDLDLLYFGDIVMDTVELILPHPHVADRLFVIEPLAELGCDFRDHVSGLSAAEMVERLQLRFTRGEKELQEITRSSWGD